MITMEADGKSKVSMGKRKMKPKKRGAGKKEGNSGRKSVGDEEIEEPIDPDEPTYCICDDVSWGMMIACENDKVCNFPNFGPVIY